MFHVKPTRSLTAAQHFSYVAGMATPTRIHKGKPGRLYLREHRKAKQLSAEYMAGRMGMERESLLRLEREALTRLSPEKQLQYADALGVEVRQLWSPPATPSLDGLVSDAPGDIQAMAIDIVRRLVAGGRNG